ncbi:hypothetical protein FRC17_010999, partial [Serendipita sp. 399]
MSLMFLPRGVAARRGATTADAQMQLDPSNISDQASPTAESYAEQSNKTSDRWAARRSKDPSPLLANTSNQKFTRRPNKPIRLCELSILIETAMSDYAFWNNGDLRRYATDKNNEGFLALSRLLMESSIVKDTGSDIAEASVLQALKEYGSGLVELQMKVAASQRYKMSTSSLGSYNVRRVDWQTLRGKEETSEGVSRSALIWERTQSDWEKLTVYVGIQDDEDMANDGHHSIPSRVQNLELPAHFKAQEGDIPVCKGFAFVTFDTMAQADNFARRWNWDGPSVESGQAPSDDEDHDEGIEEELMNLDISKDRNEYGSFVEEAKESGFRCMSFEKWDQLKKEYLERQNALYEAIKRATRESQEASLGRPISKRVADSTPNQRKEYKPATESALKVRELPPHLPTISRLLDPPEPRTSGSISTSDWEFPPGCLVFVKNLHPQTNKTALKGLFNHVLRLAQGNVAKSYDVDYVDWAKGMSS